MQARQARRRQEEAAEARAPINDDDDDVGSGSDAENEEGDGPAKTKKEMKQEQKRQEREARLAAEQNRAQKSSAYDERRQAKQDHKEAVRLAQEEEMRKAEEERIKKEEEEAAQWMNLISVDQEGTGESDDQEEGQGLLAQFVDYIKQRKTVPLEDLATEFKLRTSDVINRVQGLEAMGRLTGIMDDRGKFIYISDEEMRAVANYIVSVGRVAISDLAAKSNRFIDLELKSSQATMKSSLQGQIDFDALIQPEQTS
jgi:flagellar motor protein MotB